MKKKYYRNISKGDDAYIGGIWINHKKTKHSTMLPCNKQCETEFFDLIQSILMKKKKKC